MSIDKEFNSLLYGSYLGGNEADEHVDGGTSRFDKDGIVYQSICGGCGGYSDFPTTQNAWSTSNLTDQRCNNIVLKFDFRIKPLSLIEEVDTLICTNTEIIFINNSENSNAFLWDFGNNDTTSIILNPSKTFDSSGVYNIKLISYDLKNLSAFLPLRTPIVALGCSAKYFPILFSTLGRNIFFFLI